MKLGLFGGTFNPIHVGHLMIAEEARLSLGLDRVIFIPTGESYLKDQSVIVSRQDRLEMTRLAVESAGGCFEVSDIEANRPGPSYTCDTLASFRETYPEDTLYLILGADNVPELERWQNAEYILTEAKLVALARGDLDFMERIQEKAAELSERYGADITILSPFSLSVSSTQIRRFVRSGHAFRYLVTDPVYKYICTHGLYGYAKKEEE